MALKLWNHPTTGETRVYVNSESLSKGTKVWLTEDKENGHGFFDIRHREDDEIHRAYHVTGQCGEKPWEVVVRRELAKVNLDMNACTWEAIMGKVEGN